MTQNLSREDIRKHLLTFLSENDPDLIPSGYDLTGLVDYALNNGVQAVQELFRSRYNKTVDFSRRIDANEEFKNITRSVSAQFEKNQMKVRMELGKFFQRYDPEMLEKEDVLKKMVDFAINNGVAKLNEKFLLKRYQVGLPEFQITKAKANAQLAVVQKTNFGLDTKRLKMNLVRYFQTIQRPDAVPQVDQYVDWANTEVGIEVLDSRFNGLFGHAFLETLASIGVEGHSNYELGGKPSISPKTPTVAASEPGIADDEHSSDAYDSEYSSEEEFVDDSAEQRPFSEMSQEEIMQELTAFYTEYDPGNLGNVEKIVSQAKKLGRGKLNELLHNMFGHHLAFVPKIKPTGAVGSRPLPVLSTLDAAKRGPLQVPEAVSRVAVPNVADMHVSHIGKYSTDDSSTQIQPMPKNDRMTYWPNPATDKSLRDYLTEVDETSVAPDNINGRSNMFPYGLDTNTRDVTQPVVPRPIPVFSAVEQAVTKPPPNITAKAHEESRPPIPVKKPSPYGKEERSLPEPVESNTLKKHISSALHRRKKKKHRKSQVVAKGKKDSKVARERQFYDKSKEKMNEIQRIALEKRERIRNGGARRRNSKGEIETVNLLIESCGNYRFDPMSMGGLCVCGFTKSEHKQAKNVVNKHLKANMGFKDKLKLFGGK
eukprot:snap_masked-scaffold_2-processed-gene-16.17-mRNA-1 protein AED:1.00 eAED:1.00 QI:0/-1/0/0/-1/1/1/0/653